MILPKLLTAEIVGAYTVRLSYSDGTEGLVDFEPELNGGVFDILRDPTKFAAFKVNLQFGTLEWDNGADFAPEFMYQAAQASTEQKAGFDPRSRSYKSA